MSLEYNVVKIDRQALRLKDTMAQSKYQLATKQLKLAEKEGSLEEQIRTQQAVIDAFEDIIKIIDRIAVVEDMGGNPIEAGDLPADAVTQIMSKMTDETVEMADPNV